MSYQDLARGSGAAGGSQAQGTRLVEGQVFKLANGLSQLKKLVDQLGTARDTVEHRHRISSANASIQALAKDIKSQLTALHEDRGSASPEQQAKAKKLLQDFAIMLQDYKGTQRTAVEREAASLPRPGQMPTASTPLLRPGAGGASSSGQDMEQGGQVEAEIEKQALLQQQQQRQTIALDNSISYNEALIEERDQGIQEIARQIGEVNEMFQDLAVLINDQGVQIITIDEHIMATAERTKEGSRELVKAERSQRSYRNRCLWIWLVAALVVSQLIILTFA